MIPIHPERRRRLARLGTLDPETDWAEIYRRTVLWEFPREARLGFQLAFYRPLGVPRMAAVLADTGHLHGDTTRRAYDTGLILHEVIYHGYDSPRSDKMIRLLNALHDRPDIVQPDLTYVLNAIIVVPVRFIARAGWRPPLEAERTAAWRFWHELGRRMHIEDLPGSYSAAEDALDAYEDRHLRPSPAGRSLTDAVLTALEDRLPRPLRPHSATVTAALLGAPRFADALGLPRVLPATAALVDAALTARRSLQRRTRPPQRPAFTPGQPAGRVYPHGYQLDDLGPRATYHRAP